LDTIATMTKETKKQVMIYFAPTMVAELDAYASRNDCSRGDAVRRLVRAGLEAEKPVSRRALSADDKAWLSIRAKIEALTEASDPVEVEAKIERLFANLEAPAPEPTKSKNRGTKLFGIL
jgi:hypothetical protein